MRVLVSGYFQRGNLGDNAMCEANIRLIQQVRPDWDITLAPLPRFKGNPLGPFIDFVRLARHHDAVIFNGGTYFHDEFGLRSIRVLVTWLALLRAIGLLGPPIIMIGIGVGNLTTRLGNWIAHLVVRTPKLITARDEITAKLISSARGENVPLIADSVFMLDGSGDEPTHPQADLGVALAPFFAVYRGDQSSQAVAVRNTAEGIARFTGTEAHVRIFICSTAEFSGDEAISLDLRKELEQLGVDSSIVVLQTGPEAIEAISQVRVLLAWRFHAQLLAALAGVQIAVVPYEPKCARLREELGLPIECELDPLLILRNDGIDGIVRCLELAERADLAHMAKIREQVSADLGSVLAGIHPKSLP